LPELRVLENNLKIIRRFHNKIDVLAINLTASKIFNLKEYRLDSIKAVFYSKITIRAILECPLLILAEKTLRRNKMFQKCRDSSKINRTREQIQRVLGFCREHLLPRAMLVAL
jgi:exopolyphosphatase/pppGpp-phosphohydrolase